MNAVETQTAVLEALSDIVGSAGCLANEADVEPFVTDYRGAYRGKAQVVVMPTTTAQVSQVVAWCHAHGIPMVPQGGNTSLMGGAVPDDSATAVVISLRKMTRVLAVDTINDTMTVQAGVTLSAARTAAENRKRLFPLRIGSEGTCQIGGNLSTNAGGTAVLRYGSMRDLVLGLEVVLPDGRILSSLKGLRKDNTGYDLKQLFVGAEGTLGIITGAVLKLMPQPRSTVTAFVAVPCPASAVKLLNEARMLSGEAVTAFELISAPALDLVLNHLGSVQSPLQGRYDWMVLIELTAGTEEEHLNNSMMELLERGLEHGWVVDGAVAASLADGQLFWRIREEISDAQRYAGGSIKCDISVPISRIAQFIEKASAEVQSLEPAMRMVVYGHIGDGNVHFNPLRPVDQDAREFLARWSKPVSDLVDDLAHAENGSISAEHGIGVAKRDSLEGYKAPVELDLMWQIKRALDPRNLMNPGKLLPLNHRAPPADQ
ncbi:FAD-binding oxidoreductase [Cupriavidus alkaliphilus]|uniref:FAD-binding oxidoreductase n=1 Tax=Cupriavidus alkaliphilus TaxID=942866 RepID=UPI0016155A3F|nr:FAD-binding oxidoreductase [Cupriavidus alkaliphilus]